MHVPRHYVKPSHKARKSFPNAIRTLGDQIYVKRFEKGLSRAVLASKLDIDSAILEVFSVEVGSPFAFRELGRFAFS